MSLHKPHLWLLILSFFCTALQVYSQENNSAGYYGEDFYGKCCVDLFRKRMKLGNASILTRVKHARLPGRKFQLIYRHDTLVVSDSITRKWLRGSDPESIEAYVVKDKMGPSYVLKSKVFEPTGLSVNSTLWLVITPAQGTVNIINSLSTNLLSFYINTDGLLEFYQVDYNRSFFHFDDRDDLIYDVNFYTHTNKGMQYSYTFQSSCPCQ